jgi:hypothetical protein
MSDASLLISQAFNVLRHGDLWMTRDDCLKPGKGDRAMCGKYRLCR